VFLDPYGLDVEWKTVETLAKAEKFDVFINFSVMGVIRMLRRTGEPNQILIRKLGRIMLDINWINDLYVPSVNLFGEEIAQRGRLAADKVASVYKEQLSTIFSFVSDYAIMSNQGRPIYALVGATHKETALKIMNYIIEKYKRKH
jgi:three-Cys-motif partner protein